MYFSINGNLAKSKSMKRALKWFGIGVLLLIAGVAILILAINKDIPTGKSGIAAEQITDKIFRAIDKPAWDSLNYISWTFFRGEHHYVWDKQENRALISWEDYKVFMDLDLVSADIYKGDELLNGNEAHKIKNKAWSYWCNDSFWLSAPFKLRDPGTQRQYVKENGKRGLLVTYTAGGDTPGDSYLWWLDGNDVPTSFNMWTSIIPIKGLTATWSDWETLDGGSKIAKSHKIGPLSMSLSNIKSGALLTDIGKSENLFSRRFSTK